jgi:ABC-type bacteriocin/lantibiotic exporter with double-glycine peptidase domain
MEQNNFKNEILKIMAAFAIASFRLMPAITRIIVSINVMSFMLPVLNSFYQLHKELLKNKKKFIFRKKINFKYIEIKNLNFKYGTKKILEKFSLLIKKNEKIGIMGRSGSGKTTLINLFLGLLNSEKKSLFLLDKNRKKISDIEYLKMSHVSQEVFMFDDTLINNICIPGGKKIDKILLKKVLKQSDLNDFVRKLPNGLYTNVGERGSKISGGQKQRIGIARALYHETDLLIFDEITSSLDTISEKKIIDVITKIKDKTILFISHKKNNLKVCDRIINISSR